MRRLVLALVLLAGCRAPDEALALLKVTVSSRVPAFASYRFSVVGRPDLPERPLDREQKAPPFVFGYYLTGVTGTVQLQAQALTADDCPVGQGRASVAVSPGKASPEVDLRIVDVPGADCPASTSDGAAPGDALPPPDAGAPASDATPIPEAGPADACDSPCTAAARRCTSSGAVQTCEQDASGCLTWSDERRCPGLQTCQGDAAACLCPLRPPICGKGAGTVCKDPTTLATCALDGEGCYRELTPTVCPAGKPCSGDSPSASCSCATPPGCPSGAGNSCQGNVLVTCTASSDGCLVATSAACPAAKPCAGTAPAAACTCPAPPPECAGRSPGTFCTSAMTLVTCARDPSDCMVSAGPTTCPSGCTGSPGAALCCAPSCSGHCGGADGCGGTCPDNCAAPQTCGGGGTPNACGAPAPSSCVAEVLTGGSHSCARKADGTVWCWGADDDGQVGDGAPPQTDRRATPVPVTDAGNNVTTLAVGADHVCVLRPDDSLWCWGLNQFGQVGDGTFDDRRRPVKIMEGVASVSAGGKHTCVRRRDGKFMCWGNNVDGRLGDGTTTIRPAPVVVDPGPTSAIVAGGDISCAIRTDSTLWCWGGNDYGTIGDGTLINRPLPVPVTALGPGVASVSSGFNHTCARKSDGSVWCWGLNSDGELGDGTRTNRSTPTPAVTLPGAAIELAAGGHHTCVRRPDSTVWCWGENAAGALGDGTTTVRPSAVQVTALGNSTAQISSGGSHTCARRGDGTAWCWGFNLFAQVGDGTTMDRTVPVPVGLHCP